MYDAFSFLNYVYNLKNSSNKNLHLQSWLGKIDSKLPNTLPKTS